MDDPSRDPATGLPGRDHVVARLESLIDEGHLPAVFVAAVEDFPSLEQMDPDGSREAMRQVSGRLDRLVRASDVLGSVAPGVFVLVGADVAPEVAGALVERIEGAVALPVEVGGQPLSLAAGIGVSFADASSTAAAAVVAVDLLARAEADLDRRRQRP